MQYTPVASIATLVTRHATSQSTSRRRPLVTVGSDWTAVSARSTGTAT
jgi:hypothetical protein